MGWIMSMRAFRTLGFKLQLLAFAFCVAVFPGTGFGEDPALQATVPESAELLPDKAVENSVEQAAQKAAEKTVEKTVEKAAQKAAEKAVEKTVEKAANKAAEKAVQKSVEKAVERVTEEAMEKAAEVAALKSEQTAKRPDEWRGPTKVYFLVFVVDVDAIDDAGQNFTTNVYLRLRWQDRRLANPGAAVRQIPLESVWNPRVLLANQTGIVAKSLPDVVQVEEDGTVIYHQRYTGKLSQPLHLSDFPKDKQPFVIQFVATGYSDDHLEFIPDDLPADPPIHGGSIADELSLPDWGIVSYEAQKMTYRPIPGIHTAGFGLRFVAERYISYYLWQVVLPLGVVVMMSWSAFWLSRRDVGARIGVATSSVLTLIAHRFVLASLLPRLPYMTRMDYLTVGSTLLVMLTLIMVVSIAILESRNRERLAGHLDMFARGGFPVAFLVLLGWFLFGETN